MSPKSQPNSRTNNAAPSSSSTLAPPPPREPTPPSGPTTPSESQSQQRTDGAAPTARTSELAGPPAEPNPLLLKLIDVRTLATFRGYYLSLGDTFVPTITWVREGRGNFAVSRDTADAAVKQRAAYAADPSNAPAPVPVEPVHFSLIANVAHDHCFLRPDGYFKDSSEAKFPRPFSETILTCALVAPPSEFPQLTSDFKAGLDSFHKLVRPLGSPRSGSVYTQLEVPHIRARHKVFEPTTDDNAEQASNLPSEFTMAGWPTFSDAAQAARDELVATHIARPLPAFDLNGNLVPPSRYLSDLQGATVIIHFSLSHFPIRGKNMTVHTICVNIEHMRVLIPPSRRPNNKRPLASLTDPLSNAPQKKRLV